MLADILIRAQRGELNGAAPGSTLGLSASGGPDDPSPGSSTDGSTGSMPTTVTPPAVAQPQVPHPFAAAAHHTAASMKRSASSHSRSGSNVRPTSPSLSFTAKQRRRSSSLAGSTGSGRRLSWVPPPATPPPTAPLPMTPDEAAAAEAAKESQAASAIPEEPSTDVPSATATGVKPRQGALPLYRQNLDLAALGVPSATTGLGVSVPGPTPSVRADAGSMPSVLEADEVELTGKSFHRLSDDSPTPQSSSFGDYSMRNPGLPGLEELDDPESENHFWSQMERLGLASRLRSSVGEPVSGSETDEIVFGDDESRRAAQAARDREDVDLLARISLLRHDHHRNGSDSGSLFSIADSFATAQGSDDEVGEALSDDGSVYDGEDDGEDSYRRSPARVREMEAFPSGAASSPNQPQASTSSSPYVGGKDFDNSYRSGDSSSQATASTDALGPTTPRDSSPHMAQLEDSSRTREACLPPLAVGAAAGVTAGAVESGGRGEDEYHDTARETAIASEKARIDREDEVDYMDLADSGALMAVPRRSRVRREPVAASPAEPLAPPFPPPMRSRMPIVDTTHAAPADAAIDASSINAGTSKRMSVNVADLKAALANPAAATTTSTRASPSPSTSPSLAGPTSARVQRSFLPPPVQTELAPSKASSRSQSPKPEPIVEEIEDVSDAADAEEPAPNGDEAKSDDEHDSPMPGEARMLYQEPPSASWGFGGIGGIASGIAKLGSAAWGWGMSSVPDEVQQDDKDEEGRRRQRSVPGEFDSNRLSTTSSRLSGGSVRPDAALGSTSGRATPDEDELLEEWKDVIPFGVDPRQFIAEVRAAMRSTGTEPERGEAADIDLSEAPAVAAAVEEAAPGDEETAVVGSSGIDRAQLANAARGSPPLDTFADGVSPFGTLPAPEKPVRAKKRDTVPDATIDKAKRRSKAERRSMIITAPAQPPSIPLRTEVGSLSSTRRTVSSQSLSPSVDNMSITSSGTLTSKGSKRRKGIRSFFGGKAPPLPNSESDMSLNYARSTGSGSGDSSSPGRSRSVSDRDSPSIMSLLGNKQKVTTSQQIETDLGDMTYVSYDTGVSRSRSRSASVDVDSPQVDGSPGPTAGRPRKSSLKRQSRYDTPSRKASLTPVHAPIPEEDDKAIYGVRFANATYVTFCPFGFGLHADLCSPFSRGLGLRSTAEEEAERAGGDYHALRWIGVGRGRYGELELTGEEDQDEFYAKQSEAIKAKWRAFGRQASTDWSRVRVD